jgi:DNA-directed RNA polymerase specialized sigma24 family protein
VRQGVPPPSRERAEIPAALDELVLSCVARRAVDRPSAAELLERLEAALAALPPAERSAAVVAYGLAEGSAGVADELSLSTEDAEAL